MLKVIAKSVCDEIICLEGVFSLVISKEEKVPADGLVIRVKEVGLPVLKSLEVVNGEEVIFSGDVDEQIEEVSLSPYTELVARSRAALLIDNEATPLSLVNPSFEDLFIRFALPFGFTSYKGENRELQGTFTVKKGESCYSVLSRFVSRAYGRFLRCEGQVICLDDEVSEDTLDLSVKLESLRVYNLRCERISKVMVKLRKGEGYSAEVRNENALTEGINRVRYVNAESNEVQTVKEADRIVLKGEDESFYAEALCRGLLTDVLGKSVLLKGFEKLYVSSLKITLGKNGEYTRLVLRRKGR